MLRMPTFDIDKFCPLYCTDDNNVDAIWLIFDVCVKTLLINVIKLL